MDLDVQPSESSSSGVSEGFLRPGLLKCSIKLVAKCTHPAELYFMADRTPFSTTSVPCTVVSHSSLLGSILYDPGSSLAMLVWQDDVSLVELELL